MNMLKAFYICVISISICMVASGKLYCRPRPLSEDGDVRIAGIIQIHSSEKGKCGVLSDNEFQIAVALKWTMDILNGGNDSTQSFIPGVKIGYDIYDDCGLETLSSRRVSDILTTVHQEECLASNQSTITTPIIGLVGTTISPTTTTVAKLLTGTPFPLVGMSATLAELSNKTLYPNFIRPVPSDTRQAKVMVEIAKKLNWNYIVGLHTSDNYGTEGFKEFRRLASDWGICISETFVINRQYTNATDSLTTYLRKLLFKVTDTVDQSIGVIYFGQIEEGTQIFKIIKDNVQKWHNIENAHRIHWLMSDGVGIEVPIASGHAWLSSLLLTVSPSDLRMDEIKNFFVQLISRYDDKEISPEWRKLVVEFIEVYLKCDPKLVECDFSNSGINIEDYFFTNPYVSSAIDSVFILALTLKNAHQQLCNGVPGVCRRLKTEIEKNLLKTNYKPTKISYEKQGRQFVPQKFFDDGRVLVVDANGDYEVNGEALYDINIAKNGNFAKIGYFKDEQLNMDGFVSEWSESTKSWCKDVCVECLVKKETKFHYIPGDVLILGLFPVHSPGDAYSCGEFRSSDTSFIALLSFISTLRDLRSKTGINFGGVVVDDCYSPLRAVHILNGFFSGSKIFFDKASGTTVDPSKVIAVVGAQSSSIALNILPSLTELGIPLISYSATSSDLDDKVNYPYFLRTVPSDTQQSIAIYEIVKLLKASHVSAINVNNNYGRKGITKFIELAEVNGICVEKPVELSERDLNKNTLLDTIFAFRKNQARYVVFFGLSSIAIDLLDTLETDKDPLVFIASEAWGRNVKIIQNGRDIKARGSITLSVQTSHVASNNFEGYLESLSPGLDYPKVWFNSFWKSVFQCNVMGGFENIYSKTCSSNLKLDAGAIQMYANNQRVVQTINAVVATGVGYKATIGETCSNVRCQNPNPENFVSNIRSALTTNKAGTNFRIFDENGNGKTGFMVNNIQRLSGGSYGYVQVGSFGDGKLSVQSDKIRFYGEVGNIIPTPDSPCRYKPSCSRICPENVSQVTEPNTDNGDEASAGSPTVMELSNDGYVAAVVVLSIIIIILFTFLGILIFVILRHGEIVHFGRKPPKRERRDIDLPLPTPSGESYHPHLSCYDSPGGCAITATPNNSSSSHPSTSLKSSSTNQPSSSLGIQTSSSGRESDLEEQPSDANQVQISVPVTYLSLISDSTDVMSINLTTSQPQAMYHKTPYLYPSQAPNQHTRPTMSTTSPLVHSHIQNSPRDQRTVISPYQLAGNGSSTANPYLHPVHVPEDIASKQGTVTEPPPIQTSAQYPREYSPIQDIKSQHSAIIFQNPNQIAQGFSHNGFPSNAQTFLPSKRPETDTIRLERSRKVGRSPAERPDYKRTTSYITGEELNPFPSACDPNNSREMEV